MQRDGWWIVDTTRMDQHNSTVDRLGNLHSTAGSPNAASFDNNNAMYGEEVAFEELSQPSAFRSPDLSDDSEDEEVEEGLLHGLRGGRIVQQRMSSSRSLPILRPAPPPFPPRPAPPAMQATPIPSTVAPPSLDTCPLHSTLPASLPSGAATSTSMPAPSNGSVTTTSSKMNIKIKCSSLSSKELPAAIQAASGSARPPAVARTKQQPIGSSSLQAILADFDPLATTSTNRYIPQDGEEEQVPPACGVDGCRLDHAGEAEAEDEDASMEMEEASTPECYAELEENNPLSKLRHCDPFQMRRRFDHLLYQFSPLPYTIAEEEESEDSPMVAAADITQVPLHPQLAIHTRDISAEPRGSSTGSRSASPYEAALSRPADQHSERAGSSEAGSVFFSALASPDPSDRTSNEKREFSFHEMQDFWKTREGSAASRTPSAPPEPEKDWRIREDPTNDDGQVGFIDPAVLQSRFFLAGASTNCPGTERIGDESIASTPTLFMSSRTNSIRSTASLDQGPSPAINSLQPRSWTDLTESARDEAATRPLAFLDASNHGRQPLHGLGIELYPDDGARVGCSYSTPGDAASSSLLGETPRQISHKSAGGEAATASDLYDAYMRSSPSQSFTSAAGGSNQILADTLPPHLQTQAQLSPIATATVRGDATGAATSGTALPGTALQALTYMPIDETEGSADRPAKPEPMEDQYLSYGAGNDTSALGDSYDNMPQDDLDIPVPSFDVSVSESQTRETGEDDSGHLEQPVRRKGRKSHPQKTAGDPDIPVPMEAESSANVRDSVVAGAEDSDLTDLSELSADEAKSDAEQLSRPLRSMSVSSQSTPRQAASKRTRSRTASSSATPKAASAGRAAQSTSAAAKKRRGPLAAVAPVAERVNVNSSGKGVSLVCTAAWKAEQASLPDEEEVDDKPKKGTKRRRVGLGPTKKGSSKKRARTTTVSSAENHPETIDELAEDSSDGEIPVVFSGKQADYALLQAQRA